MLFINKQRAADALPAALKREVFDYGSYDT